MYLKSNLSLEGTGSIEGIYMARKGYITVALPDSLVNEIDHIIKSKKRGYKSRGEFVKDATRHLIDNVQK